HVHGEQDHDGHALVHAHMPDHGISKASRERTIEESDNAHGTARYLDFFTVASPDSLSRIVVVSETFSLHKPLELSFWGKLSSGIQRINGPPPLRFRNPRAPPSHLI